MCDLFFELLFNQWWMNIVPLRDPHQWCAMSSFGNEKHLRSPPSRTMRTGSIIQKKSEKDRSCRTLFTKKSLALGSFCDVLPPFQNIRRAVLVFDIRLWPLIYTKLYGLKIYKWYRWIRFAKFFHFIYHYTNLVNIL
jgi:hypothetical protein